MRKAMPVQRRDLAVCGQLSTQMLAFQRSQSQPQAVTPPKTSLLSLKILKVKLVQPAQKARTVRMAKMVQQPVLARRPQVSTQMLVHRPSLSRLPEQIQQRYSASTSRILKVKLGRLVRKVTREQQAHRARRRVLAQSRQRWITMSVRRKSLSLPAGQIQQRTSRSRSKISRAKKAIRVQALKFWDIIRQKQRLRRQ